MQEGPSAAKLAPGARHAPHYAFTTLLFINSKGKYTLLTAFNKLLLFYKDYNNISK
jgi:hypothetical protein